MPMDASPFFDRMLRSWNSVSGLFCGFLVIFASYLATASVFPEGRVKILLPLFFVFSLILFFKWTFDRRVKPCPKGEIGFLVAISVEDEATYRIFKRDFVDNIRRLLVGGGFSREIWVGEVPQWRFSSPPLYGEAVELGRRYNAAFVIFGQVRVRESPEGRRYYLDLSGLVSHAPTAEHNCLKLRQEFSELLPSRVVARGGEELPAFEMTSALSSMVAKYTVGIAAYLSGDFDCAEDFYQGVLRDAIEFKDEQDVAREISSRLPARFSEVSVARALGCYENWRKTRDPDLLLSMGECLDKYADGAGENPQWRFLRAISLVSDPAFDVDKMERMISNSSNDDPAKHMNLAFFDLLRGDLRAASRHYRAADELKVSLDTIDEVMSFIDWYKEFRPHLLCEMEFGLGFISFHLLRDRAMALVAFDNFNATRGDRYSRESALIVEWTSRGVAVA